MSHLLNVALVLALALPVPIATLIGLRVWLPAHAAKVVKAAQDESDQARWVRSAELLMARMDQLHARLPEDAAISVRDAQDRSDLARWEELRPLLYDRIHGIERKVFDLDAVVSEVHSRIGDLEVRTAGLTRWMR